MIKSPDVADVLRDLAVLYELSLSVGRSIELDENCDFFLEKVMARKSFDFASVWIRRDLQPSYEETDGAASDLVLAYANPAFRAEARGMSREHPLVLRAESSQIYSVSHSEAGFSNYVTESDVVGGTFAIYRLGSIGLLKLYSRARTEPFSSTDLRKLLHVVDKFTVSLEGCLDHARLRVNEAQRKELQQQVLHAQKLESLGLMAGGVAHDFNNLLAAILGNAELLRLSPGEAGNSVENIVSAAKRAGEMCAQLLAYSGRGKFVSEAIDLGCLVDEMLRIAAVAIPKSVRVTLDLANSRPVIEADPSQIRQVVLNLVTNAAEAIEEGSGEIRIQTGIGDSQQPGAVFEFGDEQSGVDYTFIEVADTGCGMAADACARIFDPFYTTKFTGRGLGLSAVLGIVKEYQGTIGVWSEVGGGSRVRIRLPASQNPVVIESSDVQMKEMNLSGTVLVVDDDEAVRIVLEQILSLTGFEVITAANGGEGLTLYTERAEEIDLVVLDLTMPVLSGEELFARILRRNPDARVIVTSGYSESESTTRFADRQPHAFLAKPFVMLDVQRAVRRALANLEGVTPASSGLATPAHPDLDAAPQARGTRSSLGDADSRRV